MTPMDDRHRAMLAEMGIRLWHAPQPTPSARPAAQPASAPARAPVRTAAPAQAPVTAPAAAPVAPTIDASGLDWDTLQAAVAGCHACGLCKTRTQTVFGTGSRSADWLVIGEAPGETEDHLGQPFVGQAGQLLDRMLAAVGRSRHAGTDSAPDPEPLGQVYITNVVKCRPPSNRNPTPEEIAQCQPWLQRQVHLLQPRLILAMGRFAVQALLHTDAPLGRLRGRVHDCAGVPVIATYHPAYLLRSPHDKAKAWADLCLAVATQERTQQVTPGG